MSQSRVELALYIINLKTQQTIENSQGKTFEELKKEVINLNKEKMAIYNNDEEVINKVLDVYYKDVKEN